jgi:predicted ester cyclase
VTTDTESRLHEFAAEITAGNAGAIEQYIAAEFFGYTPRADEPTATERYASLLGDLMTAMPDMSLEFSDIVAEGETMTAVATITGTHQNPLWGAPGSGNTVAWSNPVTVRTIGDAFAFRFEDVAFPDLLATMRSFGLVNGPDEMHLPPPVPVSAPEFLFKVIFTGQAGDKDCAHLDQISVVEPETRACAQCLTEGTIWPALRLCLVCGFVGCCDTSTNKHMMEHYETTGHSIMRSIRMDEGWVFCYEDGAFFETSKLDEYR